MSVVDTLVERNLHHVTDTFVAGRPMMPSLRTIVIACVDPRVDPAEVLGTPTGEVAVVRNVGGRVTPATLDELVVLRAVTRAGGGDLGAGWEVVVLQHTDCGITRVQDDTEMLASYLGVDATDLPAQDVADPHAAVAADVAKVLADPRLGAGLRVSGLVYDVATGEVARV